MAQTKRRQSRQSPAQQAKMTAEQFHDLIGRHKHIEHKALRDEVAQEFAGIMTDTCSDAIQNNNGMLHPPQPPPLPCEANDARKQQFVRSEAWPKYSDIQRIAHMFVHSDFKASMVEQYLRSKSVAPIKISIGRKIAELLDESNRYWRKVRHMKRAYKARYSAVERKQALQSASWNLVIAMTLTGFHLDHIVDIVQERKPVWSADHDAIVAARNCADQTGNNSNDSLDEEAMFLEDDHEESWEDEEVEEEEEDEEEEEENSQDERMAKALTDLQGKEKVQQMQSTLNDKFAMSLDELFGDHFNTNSKGSKNIAFAKDFVLDLESDEDDQNDKN